MTPRAVIFDIYATLLQVGPPPSNAEELWSRLFADLLGTPPPLSRTQFAVATARIIARQQATARAHGIPWPEIQWPTVVREAIPQLARLPAPQLEEFVLRQIQLGRTLKLAEGAAAVLGWLGQQPCRLGVASNAQAYTLRELGDALAGAGLSRSKFDPDLCFWSFEHGFSKPDPHVFRILTARLEARGIGPAHTLMVGDRLDNDIAPAQMQGWKTWHLCADKPADGRRGGNWTALRAWLD